MSLFDPQIVVTAPDGTQLWVDSISALKPDGSPSLWPAGFTVSVATDAPPSNAQFDPIAFFTAQIPTLLATPGPLGVEWGIWLLLLGALLGYAVVLIRHA